METNEKPAFKVHYLKCWKEFFQQVKARQKPYELRKDDRGAEVGDYFVLQEYDPETKTFTGERLIVLISGKLKDVPKFGLKDGFAIFTLTFHEAMTDDQKFEIQSILNRDL